MRDGEGNKLSEEEAAKVKSPVANPASSSVNKGSVDQISVDTDRRNGEEG